MSILPLKGGEDRESSSNINILIIKWWVLSKDGYLRKTVHEIHTSNASVATAQKENRVSISPVKTKNCNYDTKLYCFNTIFKPYYNLNRTVAQYDIFLSWLFVQIEVYFRRYKGSLRRHKSESVLLTPFVPCKWAIFLLQPFDVFHHFVHINCIHTVIQAQDLAKRLFQNTVIYKKKIIKKTNRKAKTQRSSSSKYLMLRDKLNIFA